LPLTLSKPVKDNSGATRVGLEATAKLNRKEYGVSHTEFLETGVPDVANEIVLEINAEAIKDTHPKDTTAK
jgi:polyisoprenoid-binding protein YceI